MAKDTNWPRDWRIEGLYDNDTKTVRPVDHRTVSDDDIGRADAIIVKYTHRTTGASTYRTIHGASDRETVATVIQHTIRVVSPPKRGDK